MYKYISKYALILIVLLAPISAFAAPEPKVHGSDVFFGYSRTGNDTFAKGAGGLNGWEGALHIHFAPFLGGEADVSQYGLGSGSATPHTTDVLFGPRLTLKVLGVRPFAHVLAGVEHTANSGSATPVSNTGLSYALGGGVDIPIFPFFAWRFAGDRISSTESPAEGTKARFTTGLAFRF
jgi:hypothetical protein